MTSNMPKIALRGQEGVWLDDGPPNCRTRPQFHNAASKNSRACVFSEDGSLFAYTDSAAGKVTVVDTETHATLQELPVSAALFLAISPRNTLIATWQPYRQTQGQTQGDPNLNIWDIKSGELVKSFIQKKHDTWEPQWSADEAICARNVNNEVHFFENNDFDKIAQKLHLQKVADYKIAKYGKPPYSVAAYAAGSKVMHRVFLRPSAYQFKMVLQRTNPCAHFELSNKMDAFDIQEAP